MFLRLRNNYKKQVENNTELENKNQELNKHHMHSTTFEIWYSGSGTKRYSSWELIFGGTCPQETTMKLVKMVMISCLPSPNSPLPTSAYQCKQPKTGCHGGWKDCYFVCSYGRNGHYV